MCKIGGLATHNEHRSAGRTGAVAAESDWGRRRTGSL